MHYELFPRRVSLLVYEDIGDVNYTASCQININNGYGTIDTLNGKDFYKFLAEKGLEPFLKLGLKEVRAALAPAHFRLLKRVLKGKINIEEMDKYTHEGIELVWVKMTEI